jgi:superfamily II DNA/RNA helicase
MPYNKTRPSRGGQNRGARGPVRGQRPQSRKPKQLSIHPSNFIKAAKPQGEMAFTPKHSFADFPVHEIIHRNLQKMGFDKPSPIQDQAIPAGLAGDNVVGIANTGTGKTAAFAIPVLNALIANPRGKVIIMAPTRELAQQIEDQCRVIGKGSGLLGAILIGGAAMGPQLRDLRNNPQIIIGTPGRIKDHIERRSLNLSDCSMVVLDEVDRMLDMGFVHDIKSILGHITGKTQGFYFSATMDERVRGIIETLSKDVVEISVKSGTTSDSVEQNVVTYTAKEEKIDKLEDILNDVATAKTIIFEDTKFRADRLSKALAAKGFAAESIHGGKSQSQRGRVLNKFKTDQINILVATDVAARGLDVTGITHVINYSLPQSYEDYVHRIGRAGRAGKTGHALTFVEQR